MFDSSTGKLVVDSAAFTTAALSKSTSSPSARRHIAAAWTSPMRR